MKNNFLIIKIFLILNILLITSSISYEQFNFDVTEVEIKEDGNRFLGKKRGTATTNDGLLIKADEFDYDKIQNILKIKGDIEFEDSKEKFKIFSDQGIYFKQQEKIFTEGNSKAIDEDGNVITAHKFEYDKNLNIIAAKGNIEFESVKEKFKIFSDQGTFFKQQEKVFTEGNSKAIDEDGVVITAHKFEYDKNLNIIIAKGNVKIIDVKKDYVIFAKKIKYFKNEEKIITEGKTKAIIESKYTFNSRNVLFLKNKMQLSSSNYSTVQNDNDTFYELEKFKYYINDEVLKGENVDVITNYSKYGWYSISEKIFYNEDEIEEIDGAKRSISSKSPVEWIEESDKFNFKNIITSFKDKKFKAGDTKILFHNNIFDNEREKFINLENAKLNELFEDYYEENNPRLYGVSSSGNENETIVNKGTFTSCKINDSCPAWSFKSKKITHDKIKRQVVYKDAILNIYDVPVFYFPKFFHPDPTVKRQSGLLKPELNGSKVHGTSFSLPYFHIISDNKDLTFSPTIFDSKMYMFQNEYRQVNKNSNFIADFGYVNGYTSSLADSNKNSLSHLFAKFNSSLNLNKFLTGGLKVFFEKTSNDTYLRVFDANIKSTILPSSTNQLKSGFELDLDQEDYNLTTGMTAYESLSGHNSDRYQYILPYYSYSKDLVTNLNGNFNFSSSGSNNLRDTNNLRSSVSNNLNYYSQDYFSNSGFKNDFGIYFKNFNVIGKNDSIYKSAPQLELMNIIEATTSFPLIKRLSDTMFNTITPKISFRMNPTNMKNHAGTSRTINADNIFNINRLGIGDSYESGRSLTFGLDYRRENLEDLEKYFEFKLATVIRDELENDIPTNSTINRTSSNIFGSITNKMSDFVKIDYDFAIDNDIHTFEQNSIAAEFSINNFVTEFTFEERNGIMGDSNTIENTTSVKIDNNNYLTFATRRNRKTSLTEYYDLVYEYKNDCLTAGVSYKKTYYNDRDIIPTEDLFFTITLFPLTTLEQKVDQNFYRER